MFSIDIDYILFNIILLFTYLIAGYNISRKDNFWKNAIICVIVFTVVLGCRYGRGNDYFTYIKTYKYDLNSEFQPLFSLFNNILKAIQVDEKLIFIFYALIFSFCSMIFLKSMRTIAKYTFPTFIITYIAFEEYMIRQAFSYSFVFIALYYITRIDIKGFKYKYILYYIFFSVISHYIHSANSLVTFVFIFLYFFYKKLLPLYITIPAYIVVSYFFEYIFDFHYLDPVLSFLGQTNDKYASYVENSDYWFSEDGVSDIYSRNLIIKIFETIGNISLFYFGFKIINDISKIRKSCFFITVYNIFVFGSLIQKAFMNYEILNRVGTVYSYFSFIPLSLSLYYHKKYFTNNKILYIKILYFFLVWWIYDYIKYIFFRGDMTLFIWDI